MSANTDYRSAPEVPSPCVDVCAMNTSTGLCEGCLRTIEEIANWSALNNDTKRLVLRNVAARRAMKHAS
jgi:uncharacterized protein